jgi:drug/metabolite transporter (DMT)-like permease
MTSMISAERPLGGVAAEPRGRSGDVPALERHRPSASAATRLFSAGSGALLVLSWTSSYLVGKIGQQEVPPFALLWWRFMVATVVLGIVSSVSRAPWPRRPTAWMHLVVGGFLMQATQFAGIYLGLDMGASAGLASLIVAVCPLVIAVLAGPLPGKVLRKPQQAGLVLGLLGVAVAVGSELGGGVSGAGLSAVIIGVLAFAGGTLYQRNVGRALDLRAGLTVQLAAATAFTTPLALGHGGLSIPTTPGALWPIAWLSLVCSIGGYVLLFVLLRRRGGGAATGHLFLVPPVTALLAIPLLGQPLDPGAMVGTALAAVGVALVVRSASIRQEVRLRRSG